MYLRNIMNDYLNENQDKKFEVENNFKPITTKKSTWNTEQKKLSKRYDFEKRKFLEAFIIQIIKYIRESECQIEVRFKEMAVGIIIHALSPHVSEIETRASKEIDKIKKDVMYYYAD